MKINRMYGGQTLRIAVGITMLAILLLAGSASAATLTVNASGGADYMRIQDAINNATAGDTILVYRGIYYENVNVNKQLLLLGIRMPVVDAGGSGSTMTLAADGIIVEGFTVTGASGDYPNAGIKITSKNNMLSGNNASSNSQKGIILLSSSNNTLSGNKANSNQYGIYLFSSSNNTLSGNNVNSNSLGILLSNSSNNNTLNGNIANSNNNIGIRLFSSGNNTLRWNNASSNNEDGIYLTYSSNNNTLIGNNVSNNGNGIFLLYSNNNILNGNNASKNWGESGIVLSYSNNNTLTGNIASNNNDGIEFWFSNSSTLNNNIISKNQYGIYLIYAYNNIVYNNYFNNTNNLFFNVEDYHYPTITYSNAWNRSKTLSTNIISGPYLGGNYWAYPNGTGFSQTCTDANGDGICDSSYVLEANNTDYLPLAMIDKIPQQIQQITTDIQGLVTSGVLNKGQGNSLTTKLESATEKLNKRNKNVAINELQAFIKEVQANVRARILTQAQGQELIDAANAVISQLVG